MIKDIQQKLKAIRYCVAMDMLPYMEVIVRFSGDIAERPADITDVDVLGVSPAAKFGTRRVFFDCKTSQRMSAINRALWAGGLREIIGADEGFVILSKAAPEGHRLAGNSIKIRLFSEGLFDKFAASSSKNYLIKLSYLENLEVWNELISLKRKYPKLSEIIDFLNSQSPLELNPIVGFRSLLSFIKKVERELDPEKKSHKFIFSLIVSQSLLFFSEMARDYHNIFDPNQQLEDFSGGLRYYLWGGKESYEIRKRLNNVLKTSRGVEEVPDFELPAWPIFIEMFRSFMDSPHELGDACLPVKEIAFRELSNREDILEKNIKKRLLKNNRIQQFSTIVANYLVCSSRLPKDFYINFEGDIRDILKP